MTRSSDSVSYPGVPIAATKIQGLMADLARRIVGQGIVIGGLLITLGLIQAIAEYAPPRGARSRLAVIKPGLLRTLHGAGVTLREIEPTSAVYPQDGPLSGYFYHSDPVVLAYWLANEIGPSVERAIARYHGAGG